MIIILNRNLYREGREKEKEKENKKKNLKNQTETEIDETKNRYSLNETRLERFVSRMEFVDQLAREIAILHKKKPDLFVVAEHFGLAISS